MSEQVVHDLNFDRSVCKGTKFMKIKTNKPLTVAAIIDGVPHLEKLVEGQHLSGELLSRCDLTGNLIIDVDRKHAAGVYSIPFADVEIIHGEWRV